MSRPLQQQRQGSTLIVTLSRPQARNAINAALVTRLEQVLLEVASDDSIHALVVSAEGPVFLAGGDLKELSKLSYDRSGADQVIDIGRRLEAIERCPTPVIAAVNGAVFGGGCELLMMFDFIILEEQAKLRFVHRNMGLVPAWGGATRLAERVGPAAAREILLRAACVNASRALQLGLCSDVAKQGGALDMALKLATEMSSAERPALAAIKSTTLAATQVRRAGSIKAERDKFRSVWGSPAHRRAFAAFLGR